MKKVRLFNLTDVETPSLKEKGWVSIVVAGSGFAVAPGESAEVLLQPHTRPIIQSYIAEGLLAADVLPTSYGVQKNRRTP